MTKPQEFRPHLLLLFFFKLRVLGKFGNSRIVYLRFKAVGGKVFQHLHLFFSLSFGDYYERQQKPTTWVVSKT